MWKIIALFLQHNFTDGMALGSAFLNHGTIGGWSRTLFLLAHEIPQEVMFINLRIVIISLRVYLTTGWFVYFVDS